MSSFTPLKQQNAGGFFFGCGFVGGEWTVEKLVDFEVDLKEGGRAEIFSGDQGFAAQGVLRRNLCKARRNGRARELRSTRVLSRNHFLASS